MPDFNGAHLLVKTLKAAGVDVIFTLSGNQILPIYDACLDEGMRVVDTRHENAAVHAADAYARLTGRPAVCLVTAGPGHTNALTGLATAHLSESPVLLLSGGSELARAGMGAFQEMDQVAMAAPLCKASLQARYPGAVAGLAAQAFRTMLSGRPGPVSLTLPADILTGSVESSVRLPQREDFEPKAQPATAGAVAEVAKVLTRAQRPLILGGPSLAWGSTGEIFAELLSATRIPGYVMESPRGLSDPALHGVSAGFRYADVVLLLGAQDFTVGFASEEVLARDGLLIEVGPDSHEMSRNRVADFSVVASQRDFLRQLRDALNVEELRRKPDEWFRDGIHRQATQRAQLANTETSDERPIHPLRVCAEVRAKLGPGDIVAQDGGEFGQWARWVFGGGEQRVVLNGKIGMIGCAIPFALGARVAAPEAKVVAFLGDGTFGFHGFELDTAVRHNLPFVAIIGHDAGWAAERHRQDAIYGRDRRVAADLLETRYDEVARALGADGELIEWPEQLGSALDRAFASGRPTVLNVRIASIPSPAAAAAK